MNVKKLVIFGLVVMFLLSGCEQLKELYGIQTLEEEEYIPIEEISIEGGEEETPEEEAGEEVVEVIVEEETPEEEAGEEVVEVIVEEGTGEEAKVIIVEETELVSLKPQVVDPDKDQISFTYTTPLDTEGKWKTSYGDEGEYTVSVTASDGDLSATKDVLIIVNKKEEIPVIDEAIPAESTLKAIEDSKLEFSIKASDLNDDALSYSWQLDGGEVSTDTAYTYEIGYDGAGEHIVNVVVSDGVEEVSENWNINVKNVNRLPVLAGIEDINVKETENVVLAPSATDPDEDALTYSVSGDKFSGVDGGFEWQTTYDDAGEYAVTVTATDGEDSVSQEIEITVGNVNRPPVIEDILLG